MALLLTATADKKITIKGTTIELLSLYLRVGFLAHSNGRTVEAIFEPYCDKDAYDRGEQINTTFETERITFDVGVNEQTLTDVYLHIIAELNNLGYITTII